MRDFHWRGSWGLRALNSILIWQNKKHERIEDSRKRKIYAALTGLALMGSHLNPPVAPTVIIFCPFSAIKEMIH